MKLLLIKIISVKNCGPYYIEKPLYTNELCKCYPFRLYAFCAVYALNRGF